MSCHHCPIQVLAHVTPGSHPPSSPSFPPSPPPLHPSVTSSIPISIYTTFHLIPLGHWVPNCLANSPYQENKALDTCHSVMSVTTKCKYQLMSHFPLTPNLSQSIWLMTTYNRVVISVTYPCGSSSSGPFSRNITSSPRRDSFCFALFCFNYGDCFSSIFFLQHIK